MGKEKTLLLIDGHALAFREYYALERTGMKTSDGTPTWAVFGFFKSIFELLKNQKIKTDAIAVTFDVSHHTFRVEKYSNYKSNREQMPDAMRMQMDYIYEGLRAFNIPIYTKEGYEADDVIGTISKKACELGHKVLILTGDQDAFQLIDKEGCVKVIIPSKGELKEYDWNAVYDKLGVYPNQIIDYKSLRGDTSDCIPGVRGIGEKTAQALLKEFSTLENILSHTEEITAKAVRQRIETGVEDAKLSYYLATIIRDLDINFDFDKAKVEMPDVANVTAFLRSMQFYTFLKNLNNLLSLFGSEVSALSDLQVTASVQPAQTQLGLFSENTLPGINEEKLFEEKLVVDSQDLKDLCEKLKKVSVFALDTKSIFQNAMDNKILGISIAVKDGVVLENNSIVDTGTSAIEAYYIPINHENLPNQLSPEMVLGSLKEILENPDIKKTTFNAKDIYNLFKKHEISLQGVTFDVQIASYISNTNSRHDLDIQSIEYLNHSIYMYSYFEEPKKHQEGFECSNIKDCVSFACDEVSTIFSLTCYWFKHLKKDELKILYEIELPLSVVLAELERNGVSIDPEYLMKLSENMNNRINRIKTKIYTIAECGFNINSPKQVAEILFDKLGLKGKKRSKSTSAEVLEELAEEYEIAKLILDYRKYTKLKSTYTDALPALISKSDNRIHTSFNQTVTATGRLSSSTPNLQNIPARTEEGSNIRAAFVPKDRKNSLILSADYSQIELRLLAHMSKDAHLIEAFKEGTDVHTLTAARVFEVPIDKVTKKMRRQAKAVNFGIIYGQSKYGLAKSLGISNQKAEEFINKYFETYPNIKLYMETTTKKAEKKGYVETVFGRRRYLKSEFNSPNAVIREFAKRAAINQPIQGTAADLMKLAMIDCSKKFKAAGLKSKIILQVHDELVVETLKSEQEEVSRIVTEAMELGQPLRVPLVVDIVKGETWKE